MKIRNWLAGATLLLTNTFGFNSTAQVVKHPLLLSFEKEVPQEMKAQHSSLSISDRHFKDGEKSLKWDFTPGAVLTLDKPLHFEKKDPTGKDTYLSAFIVWVYNEKAQDKKIRFEFLKDGKLCSSFPMGINFTGWRGAWVCYERDMEGTPEEGMNQLRIVAPDTDGTLYFDHIITGSKVDARQQTADLQVPFVNKETTNHWLVIYKHSLWKPDIALKPLTEVEKKDIAIMEERFKQMIYTPSKLSQKQLESIKERFSKYHISYKDGAVTGLPIFMVRQAEAYERMIPNWNKDMFTALGMEMKEYFDLMKEIAIGYQNAKSPKEKSELKDMFIAMYDHITDQGVAYGSCWGNIHHYGYSMRGLYVAYFLMKDVLRETGKLAEAEKTLRWYAITNEVYPKPTVDGIDIDSFNTQTQGRIASILIMEDSPEKLQYLRSFSRWIDYGCRPADGLMGSFKVDGGCFHHCNNYPAYAVGGLEGATNMIYLLSGTEFKVSEFAHATVKKVLLTMRFYCNLKQWALSMSGRHPNGKGKLIPSQYATMALAGTPDGKQPFDKEMAEAFMRLTAYDNKAEKGAPDYLPVVSAKLIKEYRKQFTEKGIAAEPDPQGNLALGYGCVSVQRRDNWAAVVRGHSRYLWAAEHYLPANFYGRYLAHGSMQILTGKPDQMVTLATSGWQEKGFDWNRIPGVTSIHLPFDQLRAKVYNVDTFSGMEEMLYSDEAFAGGLSQENWNGNFGMKLHEHDKYNGTHRARKSYHFINGMIVCLGSDIENKNYEFPTETTIFQLAAITPETKAYWKNCQLSGRAILDPNNVGYLVSKESRKEMKFEKNFPQITVGERSTKPTKGDWVALTLQHGKAPQGEGYEYAVFPRIEAKLLKKYEKKAPYRVLQRDRNAHIVSAPKEKTISYVLFEKAEKLPEEGIILKADTSCLAMTRLDKMGYTLTVAQPDLAFYRGASDEAFDKDGKRIERSIYSRPWIKNASGEITVNLTLKGEWNVEENPSCHVVSKGNGTTVLSFICKDGASYNIKLTK